METKNDCLVLSSSLKVSYTENESLYHTSRDQQTWTKHHGIDTTERDILQNLE